MHTLGVREAEVELHFDYGRSSYLDWTVDGVSLAELTGSEGLMTLLSSDFGLDRRLDLLRRLRGDDVPYPDFAGRLVRTRRRQLRRTGIYPSPLGICPDGRLMLYVCPCGDPNCPMLSADVVVDDDVRWRDIAWHFGYEPYDADTQPVTDTALTEMVFARQPYDALLSRLLADAEVESEREGSSA